MATERFTRKRDFGVHHHARHDARAALQRHAVESFRIATRPRLRRKKDGSLRRRNSRGAGALSHWRARVATAAGGPRPAEETLRFLRDGRTLEKTAQIRTRKLRSVVSLVADMTNSGSSISSLRGLP